MRILMTADAVGGVYSYAVDIAREFCARGAEVTLAVLGPPPSLSQRADVAGIVGLELECCPGALEWMDEPWEDVDRANAWLLRLAERCRPDLVHLNGYCAASLDFGVPKLVVAHSSVFGWWRAVLGERAPTRFVKYGARVTHAVAQADLLVAPTLAMLRSFREDHAYHGLSLVIANGVDPELFQPREKRPFFAAAGRLWDQAKNLSLLARVSHELAWPVHVAGGKNEHVGAGTLCLRGVLSRAQLSQMLGRASVFLHPARYEPFGLAPLEAALCGAVLVLGDIESLREVWGNAAVYVSPDDPRQLVHVANGLARDPSRRVALGKRARAKALTYTCTRSADAYLSAYRALIRPREDSPILRPIARTLPGHQRAAGTSSE